MCETQAKAGESLKLQEIWWSSAPCARGRLNKRNRLVYNSVSAAKFSLRFSPAPRPCFDLWDSFCYNKSRSHQSGKDVTLY